MGQEIVVIGGGLVGCITAIQLAQKGFDVSLVERKPDVMSGTSQIPLHLHQGGMYVCDANNDQTLRDCLTDAESFKEILGGAMITRPMAFAVISDKFCIPPTKEPQQTAKYQQMCQGFAKLSRIATELDIEYPYREYSIEQLRAMRSQQQPDGADKFDVYTQRLANAVDLDSISGIVITEESGLSMVQANRILAQKLRETGVKVYTKTKVTGLSQSETGEYVLSVIGPDGQPYQLPSTQIVNATGHAGFQIDSMACASEIIRPESMAQSWRVEAKGIGIVTLPYESRRVIDPLPEICFMHGQGMSHFAPLPNGRAGVTFTDKAGTTISKVVVSSTTSYQQDPKQVDDEMTQLDDKFFDRERDTPALLERTQACLFRCTKFIPALSGATPEIYLPGALGIVNGEAAAAASARSSQRVYCSEHGYHAVNAVKGGGAASAASVAVDKVCDASTARNLEIRANLIEIRRSLEIQLTDLLKTPAATSQQAIQRHRHAELETTMRSIDRKILKIDRDLEAQRIASLRQRPPTELRQQIDRLDSRLRPDGKADPTREMRSQLVKQRAEHQRALQQIEPQESARTSAGPLPFRR